MVYDTNIIGNKELYWSGLNCKKEVEKYMCVHLSLITSTESVNDCTHLLKIM